MNDLFEKNLRIGTFEPINVVTKIHVGQFDTASREFRRKINDTLLWADSLDGMSSLNEAIRVQYLDNPETTVPENQRTAFCVPVSVCGNADKEIVQRIEGGLFAVLHIETTSPHVFQQAWQWLFVHWLPSSGYVLAEQPPFEKYLNNPEQHPDGLEIVEICVPVKME